MRLVTWNCFRGDIVRRVERLQTLNADLIALQECHRPAGPAPHVLWRGSANQPGVAVVSASPALRIEPMPGSEDVPGTVLPVVVHAPEPFVLVNIWALPEPTYEAYALNALSLCMVGASLPVVAMGDFNSTPIVEAQRRTSRELIRRLRDEFGLVSAYHAHLGVEHGREPHPTFFANRHENRPFHLDYCFVPARWVDRISTVEVGSFSEWSADSDHRPLLIEL